MGMVGLPHLFASWRPFSGHHHRVERSVRYAASLSSRPCPASLRFDACGLLSFVHKVRTRLFVSSRAARCGAVQCGAVRCGAERHYFLLPFRFRNYTRFVDVTRYSPPYRFTFELHATKEEASRREEERVYLAKDALSSRYIVSLDIRYKRGIRDYQPYDIVRARRLTYRDSLAQSTGEH